MITSRSILLTGIFLLGFIFSLSINAQEVGKLIKSERIYKLYGVKEKPKLEAYSSEELEDYISKEFKYNIQKEISYDRSGRITQQMDFRRSGVEKVAIETKLIYTYNQDTITVKQFNEDETLRLITRYREKKHGRQTFQHSIFRSPEIMTPGITSKPSRKETIHYYNLPEAEQQKLVNNISDNYPVNLIFKNEIEEDGFIKLVSARSKGGTWPPNLLKHKITDPKTGNSVLYHCQNTFEEIDIEYFPKDSDTLSHRVYKKITVNFGFQKNESPDFRPNQSFSGDTVRHEEWITLVLNDSTQITNHFTFIGAKEIRKVEKYYTNDQLTKVEESTQEGTVWNTPYTENYFKNNQFSLKEINKKKGKKVFKNYYLTIYEYY